MKKRRIEHYGIETHNKLFGTEEQCQEHLKQAKWKDGRPTCPNPNCRNKHMNYYLSNQERWKCSKCKRQFSLKQGTIFEYSKISLSKWYKAIFYMTTMKRGINSIQLSKFLEIEQRSAWYMLHRLRAALDKEDDYILDGIVEVDETEIGPEVKMDKRHQIARIKHYEEQEKKFGLSREKKRTLRGKPAKTGRKKGETKEVRERRKKEKLLKGERVPYEQDIYVLGMYQRDGNVVLKLIGRSKKCRTAANIHPHLKRHINSKSVVYTDMWNGYKLLDRHFSHHEWVNHEKKEYVRGDVSTNSIEGLWSHLKRTIDGTYMHWSYQHFKKYLNEFSFRWNRRKMAMKDIFLSFFDEIVGRSLRYIELTTKPKNPYKIAA